MNEPSLLDWSPRGSTIVPRLDNGRLSTQLGKVLSLMSDGTWRTLREISDNVGAPEASVSARLRDIRGFGWTVDRRRRGDPKKGLHEYKCERAQVAA